jgi:hypothetical protein
LSTQSQLNLISAFEVLLDCFLRTWSVYSKKKKLVPKLTFAPFKRKLTIFQIWEILPWLETNVIVWNGAIRRHE